MCKSGINGSKWMSSRLGSYCQIALPRHSCPGASQARQCGALPATSCVLSVDASCAGNQQEVQEELSRAGRTFAKYRPVRRAAGSSNSAASFSFSAGQAGAARFGSAAAPLTLQVSL